MKIIIRGFTICVIGFAFLLIHLSINIRIVKENELEAITKNAFSTTQISMREQIEDTVHGTNNARCNINDTCFHSNEDYLNDFKNNLTTLISADGEFEIRVYGADYQKGLLDVEVVSTYYLFGRKKQISIRKTSIINIETETLNIIQNQLERSLL